MSGFINTRQSRSAPLFDVFLLVFFVVAIFSPLCAHVFGLKPAFSNTEKRQLTERPTLPKDFQAAEAFPRRFDAYVNDRFGLRSRLLYLDSLVKWRLGFTVSEKVLRGKHGWLFLGKREDVDIIAQHRGLERFDNEELLCWVEAMVTRQQWLKNYGIPFIVVVPPNKHSIYSEYLPDRVGPVVGQTPLEQLSAYIKKTRDLDFVDLRDPIRQGKSQYKMYYKTDSHWNDMGGFAGYTALMDHVRRYFPNVHVLTLEEFSVVNRVRKGDLAQLINLQEDLAEEAPALAPRFPTKVLRQEGFGQNSKPGTRPMFVETDRPDLPTVVIFHDSFIWGMFKFLKEDFNRVTLIHHRGLTFDRALIEREKPDLVIYELVERTLKWRVREPAAPCNRRNAARSGQPWKGPFKDLSDRMTG